MLEAFLLDWFWLALVVKLAASAGIVVTASFLVERSAPFLGAMIATLPISAGPAYVFLALDHGPSFIGESSLASLSVNAATILFLTLYARIAPRHGVVFSLCACYALWIACTFAITQSSPPLPTVLILNLAAFTLGFIALRHATRESAAARKPKPRWWDVPARALAVMVIVITVLVVGEVLGPRAAGIAALMPVVLTSLAIILHPRIGGAATSVVFAHSLPGMVGFALALLVLHLSVVPLGSAAALTLALVTCLVWNGMLILERRWKMR
ncbi:MAG: hypothetical protein JOY67_06890 [Hyphomicrobiales bacterium]|nr:hypothetical protein [Hyphomicrobiales bacterium]